MNIELLSPCYQSHDLITKPKPFKFDHFSPKYPDFLITGSENPDLSDTCGMLFYLKNIEYIMPDTEARENVFIKLVRAIKASMQTQNTTIENTYFAQYITASPVPNIHPHINYVSQKGKSFHVSGYKYCYKGKFLLSLHEFVSLWASLYNYYISSLSHDFHDCFRHNQSLIDAPFTPYISEGENRRLIFPIHNKKMVFNSVREVKLELLNILKAYQHDLTDMFYKETKC